MKYYGMGHCHPECTKRCVGEFQQKYKVYETCFYHTVKVCSYCGYEYEHRHHHACPRCGAAMDDPPRFGGFGGRGFGGREFGRFGEFGRRRGFPGFFPLEEEIEEEEEFI
ncbi:MAG: hypothetical protein H6Q67_2227 [Firmicutes bacterium]|nr:hypothetical protein [Bacillota bacterium]